MRSTFALLALIGLYTAPPAFAEVVQAGGEGFAIRIEAEVTASPEKVWAALVEPARYWNPEHSWSGDSANFTLEAEAGGCFCENLPAADGAPSGSAVHMQVTQAVPHRMLRLSGALGPLQSEALAGTLTITIDGEDGRTAIVWEYVVGGYARFELEGVAAAVDQVLSQQLDRLAATIAELP